MAKLVRDYIPELIPKEKSHLFRFTTLAEQEYGERLNEKLLEEIGEYLEAESVEELADVFEVLEAIITLKQLDLDEVKQLQKQKRMLRGGFEKRLLMEDL
jgi:predicted house-cleaning noncanonical NTP pyrophosphatase (MazG superfamily)